MKDKCTKCGADIPADSKFCLQCGEKVGVEMRTTAPPEQAHMLLRSIFSKDFIAFGVLLGLLFAWIGTLIITFANDKTGMQAAAVLNSLGFFMIGAFLLGGGIVNNVIDKFVRLGMIFGGAFLVASSLVVSVSGLLTTLLSLSRYGL